MNHQLHAKSITLSYGIQARVNIKFTLNIFSNRFTYLKNNENKKK